MDTVSKQTNKGAGAEWLSRYHLQPERLPVDLRAQIECLWQGERVDVYALVDLDESLRLTELWWVLGRTRMAVARAHGQGGWEIRTHMRSAIAQVHETAGLSCTRVSLVAASGEILETFRYSHRQRRAAGNVVFLLDQQIKDAAFPHAGSEPHGDPDELYVDACLASIRDAQSSKTVSKLGVIWRLLGFLRPYRWKVARGMAGAVLFTSLALLPPFLTGHLLDRVIRPHGNGLLSLDAALSAAWVTIAGLALVFVARELAAWVRLRTMSVIGEYVASDLREAVYGHLHKLSLSYFSSKQTGSIISRVSSDTDRIWDFIAFGVVEVTTSVLMLTGLGAVLLALDWRLGLIVTVPIPIILGVIAMHGRRMQTLFLRAWRKWSALTDCLSDTIPGVRVVKAFNRETQEVERFRAKNRTLLSEFERLHSAWTSFWPLLMLSIQLVVLAVWVFGLPRVLSAPGSVSLSPGTFVSFVLYLTMFIQPIEVIGQMARMVNRATSSAYRVFEVLDTEPQLRDRAEPLRLESVRGDVSFRNVVFSYDGVRQVVKNVSLDVAAGEMIGLVGPSGSGKTTLINLLARFYDVTDGALCIDGHDVREIDSGLYRRQIGMVLQDPYLFHGTILENIRYARPEASEDEVLRAAKAANAHDFIMKMPHAYETIVGERGHTLSGGERQRVSIARAILLDPRILILDEATSAVDTETERLIQDAMDRLVKGRTTFAIAHRLSTLTRADRLVVLKDGRIQESGTHAELLKIEDGLYRKLFRLQQESSALAE